VERRRIVNKKLDVSIFRYDPAEDVRPRYEKYEVPARMGMTVLEALKYVYDHYSPISFRYGCRIKACGSCAVMVNDRPVLACKEKAELVMTIAPLPVLPVVKDLVIDFDVYYGKRLKIRPFIQRTNAAKELPRTLSYETVNKYRECELCTRCIMCDAVCPVMKKSKHDFLGPSLMLEIARLYREPQDDGGRLKLAVTEGLFFCDLCGKCTEICPADIKVDQILKELQDAASGIEHKT
jgi:succinate dehydrogenase/fumarate reductase iron-sulfur protein